MTCTSNLSRTLQHLFLAVIAGMGTMILAGSSDVHLRPAAQFQLLHLPDSEKVSAPDFTHPTLKGDTFRLSGSRGKIVVLNFWATWCGPCREEIPDFIELQEELSEDVRFVGVALDEEGDEVVRPFAKEYEINYPIVVDDSGEVARKYGGIHAIPTTFIINRKGNIRYHTPGRVPKKILRDALLEMIDS